MSGVFKKIAVFFVLAAFSAGLSLFGPAAFASDGKADVWSTYNTLKICRDVHDYVHSGPSLSVDMARGETEGAQLVFTAGEDIDGFSLTPGPLTAEDGTLFPASGIKIYAQKYIKVAKKTSGQSNTAYMPGYIPDMLLPMDIAVKRGENTVKKGQNQSITAEFTAESDTAPGVYEGEFRLDIEGSEKIIPVKVRVRDVDLTYSEGASLFDLNANHLLNGEYDNTPEEYRVYYETLLNDYRTCAYYLPNSFAGAEEFVNEVINYWDNPFFKSFNIPCFATGSSLNYDLLGQYLAEMALRSVPERILFDKAKFYVWPLDEPSDDEQRNMVKKTVKRVEELKKEVLRSLGEEGKIRPDSLLYKKLELSLDALPVIITTPYKEEFDGVINTYCPYISEYDSETGRRIYDGQQEITGGEKWVYTCMNPLYPYPSHHIDDYILGIRLIRWMQAAYGIDGYLYYQTNNYYNLGTGMPVDEYTNPVRFSQGVGEYPGDGYLFYPGVEYGRKKPFGSLRAVNVRDGQEDLNLLCGLDKLYRKKGAENGSFSILSLLKNRLFSGTRYYPDDKAFYEVRKTVFDLYEAASGSSSVIIEKAEISDGTAEFVIRSAEKSLDINGKNAEGRAEPSGYAYEVTQKLSDEKNVLKIGCGGGTLEFFVSEGINRARLFEGGDVIACSEGSSLNISENKAEITIRASGGTLTERLLFRPYFSVNMKAFGDNPGILKDIVLNIRNESGREVKMSVIIAAGEREKTIAEITAEEGSSAPVISDIKGCGFAALKEADRIIFGFSNVDSAGNLMPDRTIILESAWYSTEAAK